MDMRIHNCEVTKLQTMQISGEVFFVILSGYNCLCLCKQYWYCSRSHVSDLTLHWFLLSSCTSLLSFSILQVQYVASDLQQQVYSFITYFQVLV